MKAYFINNVFVNVFLKKNMHPSPGNAFIIVLEYALSAFSFGRSPFMPLFLPFEPYLEAASLQAHPLSLCPSPSLYETGLR